MEEELAHDDSNDEEGNQEDNQDVDASPIHDSREMEAMEVEEKEKAGEELREAEELPPPREAFHSEIQFTPRVFPTPSRESKAAEEEDWLIKNRKHLSKHKGLRGSADYDISESDRMKLKSVWHGGYRYSDH